MQREILSPVIMSICCTHCLYMMLQPPISCDRRSGRSDYCGYQKAMAETEEAVTMSIIPKGRLRHFGLRLSWHRALQPVCHYLAVFICLRPLLIIIPRDVAEAGWPERLQMRVWLSAPLSTVCIPSATDVVTVRLVLPMNLGESTLYEPKGRNSSITEYLPAVEH